MATLRTRHGSSGALFHVGEEHVMKYGRDEVGERVHQQGQWLARHPSPAVPRVLSLLTDAYVMPKLEELDRAEAHDWAHLGAVVARLAAHVWSRPPEVEVDRSAHLTKVCDLARRYLGNEGQERFERVAHQIDWAELPRCLTHGDPTWDNVMRDSQGGYVIIDPLPATPAVPDLRCVDLGKMMQSVLGYERIRYGEPGIICDPTEVLEWCRDENEVRATWYWTAVHLLRCAPYASGEVWNELRTLAPLSDLRP